MMQYRRKNRTDGTQSSMPSMEEEELVLRLRKDELFDKHVLLPHAELNEIVYRSVDQFVSKYKGKQMKLSIFSEPVNEAIQNTFREVYRAHYMDEYQKITHFLKRRYYRVIVLLFASIGAFCLWKYLAGKGIGSDILLSIITNVGAFCLWEVGYTQFARKDAVDERKRIERAGNAEIEFQ